jgi:hypothetical protein
VATRKWVATFDGRTRDAHLSLNGQEVKVDQPFTYNGKTAMYPGGFGDAALDANCRCTTMMGQPVEPKGVSPEEVVWREWDSELIPWENSIEAALIRGFNEQERLALQALHNIRE